MERQDTRILWMLGDNTPTSPLLLFPEVQLEDFGLNSSTEHNPLNTQVLLTAWFKLLALS